MRCVCRQMVLWSLTHAFRSKGKFDPEINWGRKFSVFQQRSTVCFFPFSCLAQYAEPSVLQTVCNADPFTCYGLFQLFNLALHPIFPRRSCRQRSRTHTPTFGRQNSTISMYKFSCHMNIVLSRCLDAFYSTHKSISTWHTSSIETQTLQERSDLKFVKFIPKKDREKKFSDGNLTDSNGYVLTDAPRIRVVNWKTSIVNVL